ncbi:MAG TPA: lipoprotein signal peptidase [Aquaticitalea sp.]|nr:lipoprotein signal peptidase [Aquaticitalea sp.]HNU60084.1 lipoprotein signal peptidase [Aquaticitalea sp.]
MSLKKASLLIIAILIIDQISKIYIKTHYALDDKTVVFDWFQIVFVENEGMAWGAKISDVFGFVSDATAKLILTFFRIFALCFIGIWLYRAVASQSSRLLIVAVSLIFAGALGNIIDSVFYGVVFEDSYGHVSSFLPEKGYATFFHGKVVDMLHFPIWKGFLPEWFPFFGGKYFAFFEPVFNVADIAISTGIGILIVFNKRAFGNHR